MLWIEKFTFLYVILLIILVNFGLLLFQNSRNKKLLESIHQNVLFSKNDVNLKMIVANSSFLNTFSTFSTCNLYVVKDALLLFEKKEFGLTHSVLIFTKNTNFYKKKANYARIFHPNKINRFSNHDDLCLGFEPKKNRFVDAFIKNLSMEEKIILEQSIL